MLSLGTARGTLATLRDDAVQGLLPMTERLDQLERQEERSASESEAVSTARHEDDTEPGLQGLTCGTCQVGVNSSNFSSVEEQRSHFQSDWHRLNVRRRLASKSAVSEEDFERLVQQRDEVSSISGSNTSSEEDAVQQARRHQGSQATAGLSCFRCADGSILAVWKSLLESPVHKGSLSQQQLLAKLQMLHNALGRWVIILSQGGHFAASLFECMPARQGQQSKKEPPAFSTVDHKTFHRYVIRAKSGGRQSGKDATGKHAKSAGSTIRRHNEAMLKQEIQDLLQAWRPHLAAAKLIFVHAPAANAAPIFGAQPKLLDRADARVRSVPFPTRRPTFSETQRVMRMLTTVYSVQEQPLPAAAVPPEQESGARHQDKTQLVASAADSKPADMADGSAESRGEPPAAVLVQSELHAAARDGDAARVAELLEAGHDPTAVDSEGRTPYAAAASKAVRDCMRRHMGAHAEQWDWTAAGVPTALTAELEARQAAKQAEKKARQREREKERKRLAGLDKAEQEAQAKAAAEAEIEAAAAQAAAQSARGKASAAQAKPQVSRAEQQAQARRQQLAAAAEARMAALQQAASQQQLW